MSRAPEIEFLQVQAFGLWMFVGNFGRSLSSFCWGFELPTLCSEGLRTGGRRTDASTLSAGSSQTGSETSRAKQLTKRTRATSCYGCQGVRVDFFREAFLDLMEESASTSFPEQVQRNAADPHLQETIGSRFNSNVRAGLQTLINYAGRPAAVVNCSQVVRRP